MSRISAATITVTFQAPRLARLDGPSGLKVKFSAIANWTLATRSALLGTRRAS